MNEYRIAVFASGEGTNFQSLVDAAARGELGGASVELLICDKPAAPAVARAQKAGIACHTFRPKEYPSREDYERELVTLLDKKSIDLIVLAGYMRLLSSVMVDAYAGKIINIHPSLLPAFPGKDAVGQALTYGVKVSGVTVHFVDGGMDTGAIIAQRVVEVDDHDTAESLSAVIQSVERQLYPEVVGKLAQGKIQLNGRKVISLL
ncbi:phosphoribosylglycinamide formyltransferase [Paenibacillus sp. OT2-17]|jgi:phosphoribosylglycinamide formyltransferase-1|uniref:phosphoribosylglycinamide formyltransferase n=1 Tax=Paenibacillus sp. OT2-17 TaxID=2691605 RepID=UPI0013554B55|nr:phosphoribosylglycinamide formyltransferase [Paenibacillus sp. OT2-17]MXO78095.1 phosphoribosylglycinamide formyltransferase [Paenibacillus sp. OT2-17]